MSLAQCVEMGVSGQENMCEGVRVLSVTCLLVVCIVWQFLGPSFKTHTSRHMQEKDECITNEDS